MRPNSDSAKVKFPPPLIYLGTLLLGLAMGALIDRPGLGILRIWAAAVGCILVLAGLTVMLVAASLFRRAGTELKPWLPSTSLVTSGIYRFTRNPMYLGMTLIYAGLALLFDSAVVLALLPPLVLAVQFLIIAREERYLTAKFGAPYLDYKRHVRRWI